MTKKEKQEERERNLKALGSMTSALFRNISDTRWKLFKELKRGCVYRKDDNEEWVICKKATENQSSNPKGYGLFCNPINCPFMQGE